MKETIKLTNKDFKQIFIDEKFRNEVAFAHQCCDKHGNFLHFQTCSYPLTYIVTKEQISEAQKEYEKAKKETFSKYENELLFVSMGGDYPPRFKDDVCNHRIRTEFLNSEGKQYFIEVGTGRGDEMRVDFSIDRDLEKEYEKKQTEIYTKTKTVTRYSKKWYKLMQDRDKYLAQPFYNFGGLERWQAIKIDGIDLKYTKENVLNLVNKVFNCKFKNIVIDANNIHCNDREIICKSPLK